MLHGLEIQRQRDQKDKTGKYGKNLRYLTNLQRIEEKSQPDLALLLRTLAE
jgi:hypothetical protein